MDLDNRCDAQLNWDYSFSTGSGQYKILLQAHFIGADLLVSISGGTKPHIGAVSISQYHPSLLDQMRPSATTSLLAIAPHKEGEILYKIGGELARLYKTNVIVTGGIHIDHASPQDIQTLVNNIDQAVIKLKHCLSSLLYEKSLVNDNMLDKEV